MTEDEKKLIQARHRLEAVQARNRVLPCGQSSPSNENGRYTAKAVLMIRQFRLRKKS